MKSRLACVSLLLAACAAYARPTGNTGPRPYLEAALQAANWLDSVAVPVDGGRAWPSDPARSQDPDWTLYAGSPGVVLLHLELFAATGDELWLERARQGADALLGWTEASLAGSAPGLYTGSAGVGFALLETWRASGDERYRAGTVAVLESLAAGAERDGASARLGAVTDVIAGDAGVGFFLLRTARELERPQDLELAAALGRGLLAVADRSDAGWDWAMTPSYARRMPNFSHGTAGVATFLAALYGETGGVDYLEGALGGAQHLLVIAHDSSGGLRVYHHAPEGEDLFYLGWCHGPTGTAILFRTLAQLEQGHSWMETEERFTRSLLSAGLPDARPDGYWNNVGICCGAAGVANFLLDTHRRQGRADALELARNLTADILSRATRDGVGLRWEHAEHRVRPDFLSTQTGFMQGAAGVALWLLRLDAFEQGRERAIRLPDSPG